MKEIIINDKFIEEVEIEFEKCINSILILN